MLRFCILVCKNREKGDWLETKPEGLKRANKYYSMMATYDEFKASIATAKGRLETLLSDPLRLGIDRSGLAKIASSISEAAEREMRDINCAEIDRKNGKEARVEFELYAPSTEEESVLRKVEAHIQYRREHADETRYLVEGIWLAEKEVGDLARSLLDTRYVRASHKKFLSQMADLAQRDMEKTISAKQVIYLENIQTQIREYADNESKGQIYSGMFFAGEEVLEAATMLVRCAITGSLTQGETTPDMVWAFKNRYKREDGSVDCASVATEIRKLTTWSRPYETAARHLNVWLAKISPDKHVPHPFLNCATPKPAS